MAANSANMNPDNNTFLYICVVISKRFLFNFELNVEYRNNLMEIPRYARENVHKRTARLHFTSSVDKIIQQRKAKQRNAVNVLCRYCVNAVVRMLSAIHLFHPIIRCSNALSPHLPKNSWWNNFIVISISLFPHFKIFFFFRFLWVLNLFEFHQFYLEHLYASWTHWMCSREISTLSNIHTLRWGNDNDRVTTTATTMKKTVRRMPDEPNNNNNEKYGKTEKIDLLCRYKIHYV